jgi:hypothetical protein
MQLNTPITQTVRRAIDSAGDDAVVADLLFLERWEIEAQHGAAAALRITQIRRANPDLAAALRSEVAALKRQ